VLDQAFEGEYPIRTVVKRNIAFNGKDNIDLYAPDKKVICYDNKKDNP
jgi:hypothetical protein